jgi:hypothetical protein
MSPGQWGGRFIGHNRREISMILYMVMKLIKAIDVEPHDPALSALCKLTVQLDQEPYAGMVPVFRTREAAKEAAESCPGSTIVTIQIP